MIREEATMTSKGQVTVPKAIRDRLNLKAGDKLEFIEIDGKVHVNARNLRAVDLAGIMGPPPNGKSLTIEEIDDAIAEAAIARFERSRDRR
ncbi:MAG: AbrB/MazE/SpoVT family DNA-binding domain-containing protein [Roseitalea sp.]|jgi:AbrB family looped-hinge helix DNA binding protein|nr:AbrB/MazE/SpoVT family DNA-binding domain-containing protein [Roseitalea sp.]MBO6723570.1 AbrB/MazE/SpoVT family DNA-binding domain-containing protein [Roseitalea sp.]MBO6741858.1 AbrB/MazE/SpoVT family DNA-binding domain-containing protein [Roseitalea sp.]